MTTTNHDNSISLPATTKAQYQKPVVTTFGSVGKLTQGGHGTSSDGLFTKHDHRGGR